MTVDLFFKRIRGAWLYIRPWITEVHSKSFGDSEIILPALLTGWFMIELNSKSAIADLDMIIDHEDGELRFPIDIGKNGIGKRIIHAGRAMGAFRLERVSAAELDKITCRVRRVTQGFAISRMRRKVSSPHARDGGAPGVAKLTIADLEFEYGRCFKRRQGESLPAYAQWLEGPGLVRPERAPKYCDASVIIPCYCSRQDYLTAAVSSLARQTTLPKEIIIVDDGSTEPIVAPSCKIPIKMVRLSRNLGIAAATRAGLEAAIGEFVLLLDHDDVLPAAAIGWIAIAISGGRDVGLVYTDEDKLDDSGRGEPHFKPNFNYDLLLGQNYIGHLVAVRRDLALSVGAFGSGFDGGQDHDLILRCSERLKPEQILHIPQVCYHWRKSESSTASNPNAKPYTADAGLRAVSAHLRRRGVAAQVEHGRYPNTYRVRWSLDDQPLVTLVVPTRDGGAVLARCLEGLLSGTAYPRLQVIVVNNQSRSEATLSLLRKIVQDPRVRVISYDHPFNFSAINNCAIKYAEGSIFGLINDDIEVRHPDWLHEMVSHAVRKDVGCVGAKLLYPDGSIQHAGVVLGIGGVAGHGHKHFSNEQPGYFSRLHLTHEVSAVTGACLVVRKSIYLEVGGLDAEHLPVAFNDVDFCLRVRQAGYRNIWTPWAELVHHESKTRGPEDTAEKMARFTTEARYMRQRWGDCLDADPFYSVHLTRRREDFSLRVLD